MTFSCRLLHYMWSGTESEPQYYYNKIHLKCMAFLLTKGHWCPSTSLQFLPFPWTNMHISFPSRKTIWKYLFTCSSGEIAIHRCPQRQPHFPYLQSTSGTPLKVVGKILPWYRAFSCANRVCCQGNSNSIPQRITKF